MFFFLIQYYNNYLYLFNSDLICIEIDGRISQSCMDDLSVCPWNCKERVDQMPELRKFQTIESDVYWFETTNEEQKQRCCAENETGKALTFYFATKAVQYTADRILEAKILNHGEWKLHETLSLVHYVFIIYWYNITIKFGQLL